MKKYVFGSLLALILTLSMLCSCNSSSEEMPETEARTEAPTEAPTEKSDNTVPYWKINGRTIKNYSEQHFAISESAQRNLVLPFSSDWTLEEESSGGYTVNYNGNEIGYIVSASVADSDWKGVQEVAKDIGSDLRVEKHIESRGDGENIEYRYRFEYDFEENQDDCKLTLVLDYTALDVNAADRLYNNPKFLASSNVIEGSLSHLADKSILILGNSFVGTSGIENNLNGLIYPNGKSLKVDAVSIGMASVATYISNENQYAMEIRQRISEGYYDAVFMCGFYSEGEADNLKAFVDFCEPSDTEVIIFPAHNEYDYPITLAQQKCPELAIINWKAELDALIESGVEKMMLCYEDSYLHSNQYAGLVGAMMIYRSIYGEMPIINDAFNMYNDEVNLSKAENILGSYLIDGAIACDYEINYFT